MSTTYDWTPFFNALNGAITQYGQQNQYQNTIKSLMGNATQNPGMPAAPAIPGMTSQLNPTLPQLPGQAAPKQMPSVPLSIPGAAGTQATAPSTSYDGPLGSSVSAPMLAALRNAPPSVGLPLLLNLSAKDMERKQALQDAKVTPISDQEAQSLGLRPGGVYGRDASQNIVTIQQSDLHSQAALQQQLDQKRAEGVVAAQAPLTLEQRATLGQNRATQAEKVREFNLTNPMAASGGGAGAQLSAMPPATQAMVKAMLEGRQSPPSGMALKTPYWQNMLALANSADPTFDQTQWGARASARKDMMGGGKSYQTMNAGNTVIQHLGHLNDQISNVSGVGIPVVGDPINATMNYLSNPLTGGVNTYNDTLGHLAEETTKFYRGTGGSEADVSRNMENLSPSMSTTAKQAGVKNTVSLVYGKLAPMVEQYNKTMGTDFKPSHFLSTQAVSTLNKMGYDPDTGEKVDKPSSGGGWSIKLKTN